MAEESTKKRGRLAAAVIAGSTLAFGSFAMGIPAAMADEEETSPVAVATQEAVANTAEPEATEEVSTPPADDNGSDDADDAPASDDGEDAEPVDEPAVETQSETATEPVEQEATDTPETLQTMNDEPGDDESVEEDDEQVDPYLYVNPGSGPAGTTIGLNGSGFTKNGDVEVSVTPAAGGDAVVSETFTADEGGWLDNQELTIPDNAANGLYHVTALDVGSGEASDVADFNVTDITLDVTPETITEEDFQNTGVTLTVEGLESGDVVDFEFGNAYSPIPALADSATANEDGTAEYTVQQTEGRVYVGDYSVNVNLADGGSRVASGSFEVTSALPQVSAYPQEPTEDGAVLQGEMLNVSGHNVTSDNTVTVDFGIDGVDDEQLETDAYGNFFTEFQVPQDTEPGVKELTVTDDESGAVGTAEYTVATADNDGEVTEPTLTADRNQILLEDFVGAAEDEPGVHFTVEGLEAGTQISYEVKASGNLEDLEGSTSVADDGIAGFFIYGFDYVSDPTVYLGDYSVTATYEDEADESQTLGPVTFSVVEELVTGPQISLESNEVYQGGELEVEISNLTPNGEVEIEWNPTATLTADAQGRVDTELDIAEDAATGVQTLTVTDVATGDSNSVEYTVLDSADQVVEPALTITPERITLEKFVGELEDGAGVSHVVEGLEPGAEIAYVIAGPENVNDYESTETADEDGVAQFVIHGYEVANPAVYLGEYRTVVTYTEEDGDTAALNGTFTVVDGASSAGGSDGSGDSSNGAPAGPADLNGYTGLAQTGANGMHLGFLAGGLLLIGAAFVAYANRARLFGRKN